MVSTRACLAVLAALFAISLGGCNLVVSEKPMFSAADSAGAPVLRSGVWASLNDGCSFDEKAPISEWPRCANGSVLTATTVHSPTDQNQSAPYVLVAGDPLVLQSKVKLDDNTKPKSGAPELYFYLGVRPMSFDEQHRITAMEAWFVQCGPPPEKKTSAKLEDKMKGRDFATAHPLPGMIVEDTGMCTPANGVAVLRAAGPSEAWGRPHLTARWVRDGDK